MRIRLDTRDKKPTIYNIAFITAVVAVVFIFVVIKFGLHREYTPRNTAPYIFLAALMVVYFLVVDIMLWRAFKKQIQYNLYSYNTIYYAGFALFVISMLMISVMLLISFVTTPQACNLSSVLNVIRVSATTYMLLSLPFILVFSIALCISNISLIRHEGVSLVNVLGIILAILLVAGELVIFKINFYASGSLDEIRRHEIMVNALAAVYLYFECMVIGAMIADVLAARYEPDKDKDFAIVLGCGMRADGTPTPLLKGRIDRAIEFYKKQKEETGKDLLFITSGGQGSDEPISESECMKNYLIAQGIPEDLIIEENKSTDTEENMRFSKEKIEEINPKGKAIFSTTNYHVFRSGLFARRVGMKAQGIGAPTKWYFWPNAAVREFVGLLTKHRIKQTIIMGVMIIVYIAFSIIVYSD